MNQEEKWKDIKDYEGMYQVSNLGRIRSLDRTGTQKHYSGSISKYIFKGRILKLQKQKNGYYIINLHKAGESNRKLVHRLVAETFIENPNNYNYINHKDNNIENNNVTNLEWCTQKYNIKYAYENGNKIPPNMKAIRQIGNNNTICEYISMAEAERITGIKGANISKCCRKLRNYAGGYQWEYIEQK